MEPVSNLPHSAAKSITPATHVKNDGIIPAIFSRVQYASEETRQNDIAHAYNELQAGKDSILLDRHVVHISKGSEITIVCLKSLDPSKKAHLNKGGFGKLYPVEDSDQAVFKASRNLILTNEQRVAFKKEAHQIKAELSKENITPGEKLFLEEQKRVLKQKKAQAREINKQNFPAGMAEGEKARLDQKKEYEIMQYIEKHAPDLTGLSVKCWGLVSFRGQVGFFTKRNETDLEKFYLAKYYDTPIDEVVREEPLFTAQIMEKAFQGLETLHALGICHRDIKPSNIMFNRTGRQFEREGEECNECDVGIIDFGNAVIMDDLLKFSDEGVFPTAADIFGSGTQNYVSEKFYQEVVTTCKKINQRANQLPIEQRAQDPEIKGLIQEIKTIMKQSDRFAMGLTFYQLCVESTPECATFETGQLFKFQNENEKFLFQDIASEYGTQELNIKGEKKLAFGLVWRLIDQGI